MSNQEGRDRGITRREAARRAGLGAAGLLACVRRAPAQAAPPAATGAVAAAVQRDEVELANDRLRVVVSPSDGAGVLAFSVRRDGKWLDIAPDVRKPEFKMRYASWMMIPYSNRIANGKFTFEGKPYQLQNGDKHAIHGDGRNRPWKVVRRASDRLKLALRSADFPDFNWPWPLEVEAELALEDSSFVQRLRLVNAGTTTMPAGFGWHPYYLRELTKPGEPVRMQMNFTGVYPDAEGDCIPDGPPAAPPEDLDYRKAKPIPRDRRYDVCCSGYDGRGTIEWPESGVKLAYECTPHVTHLVYFNPTERPVWAAEPAANANDGVNVLGRGDPTSGVILLAPAKPLAAAFTIRVHSA